MKVNATNTTSDERREILKAAGNQFFTAVFIKRTTGEKRVMNCRLHVTKYLKGGEKPFDDNDYALLTVFDAQKNAYRSIALDSLLSATIGGKQYVFSN